MGRLLSNLDQRGQPRPIDGDGNGSAVCDIGAYEAPVPYSICDVDQNNSTNPVDALVTLRIFAGLQTEAYSGQGDADNSGVVTPVDALIVLRTFAGLQACSPPG